MEKQFDNNGNLIFKMGDTSLPDTVGGRFAHSIRVHINQNVWDLIPQEIASQIDTRDAAVEELKTRVKQLLSALDYDCLTPFQRQLADLLTDKISLP